MNGRRPRTAVRRLEERAGASGTDWGLGALASAQALLADNEHADSLFTEAIERLERTRVVLHLARAHLRYGEWLRRVNRRLDARRHLNDAHEMFTRMGAQAFAERARRELIATGEKVRKQPVSSGDELTAQEAQIARLAGRRPDESGDRCAAVHQHAHRRMAPAEGLRQARHHLAQAAPHHLVGELDALARTTKHSVVPHGLLTTDFQGFASPSQARV